MKSSHPLKGGMRVLGGLVNTALTMKLDPNLGKNAKAFAMFTMTAMVQRKVKGRSLPSFTLFYPLLPSFTLFHPLSPAFTLFYPLLPSFTLFYPLLPAFTLFYHPCQ